VRRPGGDIIGVRENGKPTVYVVNPDPQTREDLHLLLDRLDCVVRVYPSAEEFLSELEESRTGCLVTQHRLPGLSGLELLSRLERSDLPAIFLTGRGNVRAAVEAMRAGAASCVETPYVPRVLLNEIRRFLR